MLGIVRGYSISFSEVNRLFLLGLSPVVDYVTMGLGLASKSHPVPINLMSNNMIGEICEL